MDKKHIKKYRFIVFLYTILLFPTLDLNAQTYTIKVNFDKAPQKLYISGLYIDQFKLIDSVKVENKTAIIKIDKKTMPANYQLLSKKPESSKDYKSKNCFYLYFENENIEIASPDSMINDKFAIVVKGQKLKDYLKIQKASYKYQEEMYLCFKELFQNADGKQKRSLKQINDNLDAQYKEFLNVYNPIINRNSSGFKNVTNLVAPMHFHLKNDKNENRLSAIQQFQKQYRLNSEALLFTPLLKEKLNEFFSFFQTGFLTYSQTIKELKNAIDILLEMTKDDKSIQFASMRLFLLHIRRYSYDEVIVEFNSKYLKNISKNRNTQLMDYLVKPYLETAPGKKAKNIITKDINGKSFNLFNIKSKYTALLYFSSTCSHCRKELPLIKKWYNSIDKPNLKIITISIDANENQWREFLKEGNYPFTHICDFKSWNSPFVKNYNINGTPSMIVLDDNKVILKKIVQIEDLKSYFRDRL